MDPAVGRIIDANSNRAREGLRVVEEYARFGLDDSALSETVKGLRHDLASVLGGSAFRGIVRARDIQRDVGCALDTEAEYHRGDAREVVTAAAKRGTEALRVLEEYTKTFDASTARGFERLRYRLYELERVMAIRAAARERFADVRLYVLVTESLCSGPWQRVVRQVIEGGADCIQLREKTMPDAELVRRAREAADTCRESGVLFIVNDRPDIARLSGADGVHLGRDDLPVADARRILGPDSMVGVSTHTMEQALGVAAEAPDYIAVGPMFASATKPQDHVPGRALLAGVCAETSIPLVPIGGIDGETIASVLRAGARRVCVCSAVIGQSDIAKAAGELKRRVREAVEKTESGDAERNRA